MADSATAHVITGEGTTSTSYVDLATTTDSVTVDVGTNGFLLVGMSCLLQNSGANFSAMSFALSGANTLAATNANSLSDDSTFRGGVTVLLSGLTPGATTAKAKYNVSAGTGTFSDRKIFAIPL